MKPRQAVKVSNLTQGIVDVCHYIKQSVTAFV
jgi:hypothetical protein